MSTESLTVGVDIGGTKMETALVDAQGNILASSRRPSGINLDPAMAIADITACVGELQAEASAASVAAVGLGVAGQIDSDNGIVRESPNLPKWSNVPIRHELERALSIPAFAINDVQAATWGEWQKGAGQGVLDLVCMFVGTGIGGGIVANGRMYTGATGSAGELGHTVVDYRGPSCRCGNWGCLEAHAGGWAIALRAQQAVATDPEAGKAMLALAQDDPEALTAATVSEAAHQGDPLAQRLVAEVGEALGAGVASVVNAFNPSLVIMGGSVIEGLPELMGMVKESVQRRALPSARDAVEVVKAQLGNHAVVVGAALMARQRLG